MAFSFRYDLRSRTGRRSNVLLNSIKPGDMDVLNLHGECKVCYDLPMRTVFVNCGHIEFALAKEFQVGGFVLLEQKLKL